MHNFAPLEGEDLGEARRPCQDLARFASSMATNAGLVNEKCTIMSKRRWQASGLRPQVSVERPDMLDHLGSPIARKGLSKGILHIILQDLTVQ